MLTLSANLFDRYRWEPQPEAGTLIAELQARYLDLLAPAAQWSERLRAETGTRFGDWVDYFEVPQAEWRDRLVQVGFVSNDEQTWSHPGGLFPRLRLSAQGHWSAALKVERIEEFFRAYGQPPAAAIEGQKGGRMRRALVTASALASLSVIERHGLSGYSLVEDADHAIAAAEAHYQAFRQRPRRFLGPGESEADGFHVARHLIDLAIADLGRDWACDLFFQAEREYWQSRNHAARVQKARQDRLGMGWANHDHHTYRSSRECFPLLIGIFEQLGFTCRERFYAGLEAGWGAQVLEQPETGLVIFADVDMSPDELQGDFSHEGFHVQQGHLGTVGVWCAIHGEAFLEAGMHHLECQFDFQALREQLAAEGVGMMKPFTNFEYLTQCFTEGERWAVDPVRLQRVRDAGLLTSEQADRFLAEGAIGSHLENLERNQGYKGFNQSGVSDIIARTDPRRQ